MFLLLRESRGFAEKTTRRHSHNRCYFKLNQETMTRWRISPKNWNLFVKNQMEILELNYPVSKIEK